MIKKWADRLFRWFCHPDYYPDIQGDLEELYQDRLERSLQSAQVYYLVEVILLCRPALIRPLFKNSIFNSTGMFKNYFKISARHLVRQKVFSSINIIGLAVGLTTFLLINQYVVFEKSYDKFFTDADRLYRLTTDQVIDGVVGTRDAMAFNPAAAMLTERIPEIVAHTTTYKIDEFTLRKQEQLINETGILAADTAFLRLFDYRVIHGNVATMLSEPYSLVMTESKARSYFGDEDPMGQTIEIIGTHFERAFLVTGVIQDVPENTHYKFDMLLSLSTMKKQLEREGWFYNNYYAYVKLSKGADIYEVRSKLPPISEFIEGANLAFQLQAVEEIHLYSDLTYEPEINGSATVVSFLSIISILILVIAWANYVNLTTARSVERAREVGLRKTIGAYKGQLIMQFMTESFLLNLAAAFVALVLSAWVYPFFNLLVGKQIIKGVWDNGHYISLLAIFFLISTFVSGLYPAFVLSNFKPSTMLKGNFKNSKKGVSLRKGLVVIQFAVSIVLVAATFTVQRQINYMLHKDKGLDISYVVGFENPTMPGYIGAAKSDRFRQFKEALMSHHAIEYAGLTSALPGGDASSIWSTSESVCIPGRSKTFEGTSYLQINDEKYRSAVGIELLAGRDFMPDMQSDSLAVMVNESFLNGLGIKDVSSVLGQEIKFGTEPDGERYRIVGVVGDYHRSSFKAAVEPTVMFYATRANRSVVRLHPDNYKQGLAHLEAIWQSFFSDAPFSYSFLDQKFETLYQGDKQFGHITSTFSMLAILIALLGLFGLSAFVAAQRAKEVGIRKVLGASMRQLLMIFYREFLVLIALAAVIGIPLVYWAMNSWLDSYVHRIDFPWLFVAIAVASVASLALITVGYQTMRVAVKNPSETLRYE